MRIWRMYIQWSVTCAFCPQDDCESMGTFLVGLFGCRLLWAALSVTPAAFCFGYAFPCTSMDFHGLVVIFSVDPLGSRCFVICWLGYLCQVASCLFSDWGGAGVKVLSLGRLRESIVYPSPDLLGIWRQRSFHLFPFRYLFDSAFASENSKYRQVKIDEIPAPASKFATSFKGLGLNPLWKIV